MSLRKVKNGYLIVVIIVAVLLATLGHWLGWVASIVLLVGALPAWNILFRAGTQDVLNRSEHTLDQIITHLSDPIDGHRDIP